MRERDRERQREKAIIYERKRDGGRRKGGRNGLGGREREGERMRESEYCACENLLVFKLLVYAALSYWCMRP